MAAKYNEIQEFLRVRADLYARLHLLPYDGTPEIKERGDGKYLYVRKRVAGKQTSTYVGVYTDELYNLLLRNAKEARVIRKELRDIEKQLAKKGKAKIGNLEFSAPLTEEEFSNSLYITYINFYVEDEKNISCNFDLDSEPDYLFGHLANIELDENNDILMSGING